MLLCQDQSTDYTALFPTHQPEITIALKVYSEGEWKTRKHGKEKRCI
ncbi:hypothetical protein BTN49_2902 [Candidatus Enterovibrio escicola]|uniref:Mobile element protein n=1 Tax=Candidatus Enterovibrio escicola TaxID=1927127 RepID=A0A2A5SZL8_9GAMM|nr:hypothetical protein BTN49_2902 [Candidatus Enterovibrio escacola]